MCLSRKLVLVTLMKVFFSLENCCLTNPSCFFGSAVYFVGGKSAILTALCVAFGCRAKGTQRAATLKDFIKTGAR